MKRCRGALVYAGFKVGGLTWTNFEPRAWITQRRQCAEMTQYYSSADNNHFVTWLKSTVTASSIVTICFRHLDPARSPALESKSHSE